MSNTPVQEPATQGLSSGSGQTLPSRPLQPSSDPSASKRVCFYKSGDYQFSGHRMVINARTFKTFDALLDALSKKVPLPFGVRTITTPRGTHLVKALDDLQDGGAYVCSDQKRVKPLNLDEVNRRQVPWNTTRPLSAGRRRRKGLRFSQFGSRNEVTNRPAKVTERVAVRTPKRLMVIKNRDPTVKRTIVLQRRTAPTFDALLDYLSQILQFPVLKLYSTDGRRVDGLATLILCSGVVVAAGNEPFRLANYSFHRVGQMAQAMHVETVEPSMLQPRAQKNKPFSSGRGSRNFSLSSERYIINQINKSQNGSMNSNLHPHNGSFETGVSQHCTSMETSGPGRADNEHHTSIVPQDDDIEKSFRVNQDGSMTVEMKVRLTIKEEEMLQWTTTLSRTSLSKSPGCASVSESGNRSPDSNNAIAKDSSSISEEETKEENYPTGTRKGVGFDDERIYEGYTSIGMGKAKKSVKRTPTPGPRHVNKTASVESVKKVTELGVQESMLGHYSYMERRADGETTEGYCVVRHSTSSNRPIPKPRKTVSAGASNKCSTSSLRSSGVAEVLQIQNNGIEVTETVMHIYETQGCYDNYFANQEYGIDGVPLHGSPSAPESKQSTESGSQSSSNDCDIDCSWQPPTADSLQRQKEEMLSLSSEPVSQTHENKNNLSSRSEIEVQRNPQIQERVKHDNTPKSTEKKNLIRPAGNQKSSTSTSSTDKKLKESPFRQSKNGKHSSADKLSKTSVEKSLNSSGSGKNSPKSKEAELKAENTLSKKSDKDEKTPKKDSAKNLKRTPQRQNTNKAAAKDNGHNVNTPTGRPQMKKNMSDILQPKKSLLLGKETNSNPKSMSESRISSTKTSVSMPSLDPSPSEIHQYVENWLEKVSPDQVPYTEVAITEGTQPRMKVVFQIGGDSESDEKTECQTNLDEYCLSPDDGFKKSTSCLSVPLSHEEPAIAQGLSVSMPNVRADPLHQESRLKSHKSAEAIGPAHDETSSSNFLSPKTKIKPVLQQLCSSIQCIRRASDTNTNVTSNLEKSNSLPDFPTQVASVFGSSCKAFLSFLSVMTLRDHLTTSASEECSKSSTSSEAMLMMESLQKISAIEDEEEQRASLTDLQSRASSRMRQRWKDFQILRERLESEPLSPKFSETEFALDVVSEGGDIFEEQNLGIDELMEELRMPQDLREEIASTFKSFYPVEESQCVETDRNQSDSEEDVEQFIKECNDETEQSPESDSRYVAEDISETKHGSDNAVHNQQGHKLSQTDQEPGEAQDSQTEKDEFLKENETKEEESGEEEQLEEVEEMKIREYGDKKEMGTESEENENEDREKEEEEEEEPHQSEKEGSEEFIDKDEEGIDEEEEMTLDEKEAEDELEEGEIEDADETEEAFMNEDSREQSAEETDEREGIEEAEEEERINDKDKEGVEEENSDVEDEERQEEENSMKKEVDENMKETDEAEKVENVTEEREQETDEETDEEQGVENVTKEVEQEEEEEEEEETEESHPLPESVEQEEEEEKTEESHSLPESVEEEEEEEETEESHPLPKSVEKEEEEEETEESHSLPKSVEEEEGAEEEETEELHPLPKSVEKEVKEEETEESHSLPESVEEEEGEEEEETEETHPLPENVEDEREVSDVYSEEKEMGDGTEADEEEEVEEETCVITVTDAEEDVVDTEDGELEMEVVTEDRREDDAGEEEATEQITEVVREGINEEEEVEKKGEHEQGGGGDSVVNTEEERARIVTDEEEVNEERVTDIEDQKYDNAEDSKTEQEKTENNLEEESAEETEPVEELEMNENLTAGHIVEGEDEEDDDENEFQEKLDHKEKQGTESPSKYSSEGQCADDKGNGTDTVTELETDEGGEMRKQRGGSVPHPVEISQELLDFVNYALQSSSLIFIYDTEGNIRIEPDNARFVPTRQIVIPKSRKYSSYGLKRLPSPVTSDLSDYRPETSESGGYKTQDSVDIISESGEEASEKPSPVYSHSSDQPERTNVEWANSKLSVASNSETFHSSSDSGTKVSREDLSYFSAASSLKADAEANAQGAQCISFVSENPTDGVLIDQGRWLLKENHLIRKSPPVSLGMYGNLDSSSLDTGQENISDDSPPHYKTQHSPLAAISSSELEEMAKPQTPKCIYYNMPHGSDSDPFLDDSSIKSSIKGRGVKVSPTIDTSKTWANKNGSQSSFASVEFRIPDRKVHPEDESTVVTQPRRTPSGEGRVLQAQDSMDNLHVRCGQYCPIL